MGDLLRDVTDARVAPVGYTAHGDSRSASKTLLPATMQELAYRSEERCAVVMARISASQAKRRAQAAEKARRRAEERAKVQQRLDGAVRRATVRAKKRATARCVEILETFPASAEVRAVLAKVAAKVRGR